jgi:cytidine deaminase
MEHAYAPYSRFRVGAAVRTSTGVIVSGCNVENAVYGEALCAERVAVAAAVAQGMKGFEEIAIASEADEPAPPCGSCRQTMSEFAPDLLVTSYSKNGRQAIWRLSDLLPEAFALNHLRGRT